MLRILVVDDEPVTRRVLMAMLEQGPYQVYEAESGSVALKILERYPGPWMILLDWVMPGLDGKHVCQIVRERFSDLSPYILLMSARASRAELADGLNAGADDFLLKPIASDVLYSRLAVARRHVRAATQPNREVLAGLHEGTSAGYGELLVRDRDTVGRVLFHDHRVAWAHIGQDLEAFIAGLCSHGVTGGELQNAMKQAQQRGEEFHQMMRVWGLLSRDRLETALGEWIRRRVFAMLRFRDPRVLFVPMELPGDVPVSFALRDVVSAADLAHVEPVSAPSERTTPRSGRETWETLLTSRETRTDLEIYLDAALLIDGAMSSAVINRATGVCEGRKGQALDPRRVWTAIQTFTTLAESGDPVEDVLIATQTQYHLLRALGADEERICYVVFERESANLPRVREKLATVSQLRRAS